MDKKELVTGDWSWEVDSDKIIITIDNSELKPPLEYMTRVAKLISAAPEMYSAIKGFNDGGIHTDFRLWFDEILARIDGEQEENHDS